MQWRSRRWLPLGRTTKGPPTEKLTGKGPQTSYFTKGPTHLNYATGSMDTLGTAYYLKRELAILQVQQTTTTTTKEATTKNAFQ